MDNEGGKVSPLVKALVVLHIIAITGWVLPMPPSAGVSQNKGSDYVLQYNDRYVRNAPTKWVIQSSGIWQFWDMFAPNPMRRDIWMDAWVTFEDGSRKHFDYPRMSRLGFGERFVQERFRKIFERVNNDQAVTLWPGMAMRIALQMDQDPKNRPIKVSLVRHWLDIPNPGEPIPKEYHEYTFFVQDFNRKVLDAARHEK